MKSIKYSKISVGGGAHVLTEMMWPLADANVLINASLQDASCGIQMQ